MATATARPASGGWQPPTSTAASALPAPPKMVAPTATVRPVGAASSPPMSIARSAIAAFWLVGTPVATKSQLLPIPHASAARKLRK
jgi:hypothetical protein